MEHLWINGEEIRMQYPVIFRLYKILWWQYFVLKHIREPGMHNGCDSQSGNILFYACENLKVSGRVTVMINNWQYLVCLQRKREGDCQTRWDNKWRVVDLWHCKEAIYNICSKVVNSDLAKGSLALILVWPQICIFSPILFSTAYSPMSHDACTIFST